MTWGAVAGAAVSVGAGMLQSNSDKKAAKKAAQQVRPYNVEAGGYGATVDNASRTVSTNMSAENQHLYGLLGGKGFDLLSSNGPYGGYQAFSHNVGNNMLPGMFNNFLGASNNIPNQAFANYGGQIGGMQNMALGGAQMGLNQAFGPGQNTGLTNNMFNMGMGMQNMPVDQYRDIASNQLGLMRDLAAPQEERAANSMMQSLFSKGQMASTAGGRNFEAFGQGLSNADMQRQLASQGFAEQLYRGDQQFAQGQGQLGQGLLGMGFTGQGQDLNRQNMMGNLGYNLLGQSGQFAGQGLEGAVGQSKMVNQRSMQRLQEAQRQMFGGQSMFDANTASAFGFLGQQNNMDANLYNMLGMSGNLGAGQGSAAQQMGRLVGKEDPWAGLLSGAAGGFGDWVGGLGT